MAKRKTEPNLFPPETIIEVISITQNGSVFIFDIKFKDWLTIKKKTGVVYTAYQKGYSSYSNAVRLDYYKK